MPDVQVSCSSLLDLLVFICTLLRRQEDRTGVASLVLSPQELQLSLKEDNVEWDPRLEDESGAQTARHDSSSTDKKKEDLKAQLAGQVAYFAIFDG